MDGNPTLQHQRVERASSAVSETPNPCELHTICRPTPQFIRGLLATWPELNPCVDERPPKITSISGLVEQVTCRLNERLKKIVQPANILEPGQGGGRQGRCVGINMQKVHFIQQEARRQGKRVYRVDIDFKNAFNAMSQAALWQVMRM